MNYEDRGIDEYYEQKQAEHEELVDCSCLLIVVLLAAAVVFVMAELVGKCLR